MPILTPGRRWQAPFRPFKKVTLKERMLINLEIIIKGPVFGCRMCGNCLLQETAFICSMECPKGIRNGPCGGSTPGKCYVDETRPCIWYEIYDRAFAMGREEKLLEILPPVDWDKAGGETWGDVIHQVKKVGVKNFFTGMTKKETRHETWESVFFPVRQPDWWQGDSEFHGPAYDEPASELEKRLQAGEFVVTGEVAPPLSVATGRLKRLIQLIDPYVSAINFTDNASAMARMSSLACSKIALEEGAEPVLQIASRDYTRTGVQSHVLGAAALGVTNILCLSGDNSRMGMRPLARADILDIDSIQMLWILRRMRDEGKYLDGREIKFKPNYFLGAAASPYASDPRFQAIREHKKVNAGAQFFQTNLVYDVDVLETWLNELAKRDILDKVYILVGLTPLRSYKIARYMNDEVPGVHLPESILNRMESAGDGAEEEGFQITMELIEKIRQYDAINGLHLMSVGWEEITPRIVEEAGLLPEGFIAPAEA